MSRLSGKFEIFTFIFILAIGLFFFFRPRAVTRANSIELNAVVYGVSEGSEKSVTFTLKDTRGVYYINHVLEKGLTLETLQKELVNKEVTILYLKPGRLAGFSPVADTKHITELRLDERVIYSEL